MVVPGWLVAFVCCENHLHQLSYLMSSFHYLSYPIYGTRALTPTHIVIRCL